MQRKHNPSSYTPLTPADAPEITPQAQAQIQLINQLQRPVSITGVVTRHRAKVTPTESEPTEAERTGVVARPKKKVYLTTHRAWHPAEEFQAILAMTHEDNILNKGRYKPYKAVIKKSISLLVNKPEPILNFKNHAAVIMAKENALQVASALIYLTDRNMRISDNIRLALVRAGSNAEFFAGLLFGIQHMISALDLTKIAEIFAHTTNAESALKLALLLSNNSSSIIALTNGFSEIAAERLITNDEIDAVSNALHTTSTVRIATIFAEINNRNQEQKSSESQPAKRSFIETSGMFKSGVSTLAKQIDPRSDRPSNKMARYNTL